MAHGEDEGRARGRVRTWPTAVRSARLRLARGQGPVLRHAAASCRSWALAEVGAGRLLPWLAIAFGSGIVVYFTADREPVWWAALALSLVGVIAVCPARAGGPSHFRSSLGLAAAAAGFATAALKTALIAHPVLRIRRRA